MRRSRFRIGRAPYFLALVASAVGLNRLLSFRLSDGGYWLDRFGGAANIYLTVAFLALVIALMCARLVDAGKSRFLGLVPTAFGFALACLLATIALDDKFGSPTLISWLPSDLRTPVFYTGVAVFLAVTCLVPLVIGTLPPKGPDLAKTEADQ